MQPDDSPYPGSVMVPDISVCVANYNGGGLVLDCLASVFAQEGGFTLEVLVHDDASTDDSLKDIRRHYPDARILASETNCGFCISNNRMVEASRGRFVLLLNNDAVLRPGSVQRLVEFSRDGHGGDIAGLPQYSMTDGMLVDRGYRTDPFLNPIPVLETATHEVGVATGACLWIPRTTWNAVGGFPPWFESVAEDIFVCMAARVQGHRVFVLDQPGFDHWVGKNLGGGKLVAGRLRTTARRRALSERNKTFAMLCCYPWPVLLGLLPLHALLLMIESAFLFITGMGPGKVAAIYAPIPAAVWHHRDDIRECRRRLMQQRRATTGELFAFTRWFPRKLAMLVRHGRPQVQ